MKHKKQSLRNQEICPKVSNNYLNTTEKARAVIESNGYSSKEITDSDALQIVKDIKDGTFDPKKYGLITENFIKADYVIQQALKAGVTVATISAILKVTPEIYKVIFNLIEKGYIDQEKLKPLGISSLTAPVEVFMKGSKAAGVIVTF